MVFYFPENKCVREAQNRTEPAANGLKSTMFKEDEMTCYNLSVSLLPDLGVEILISKELLLERKLLEESLRS